MVNKENGGLSMSSYLMDTAAEDSSRLRQGRAAEIVVDNQICRFEPHVLGIRTGQTLKRLATKTPSAQHEGRFFGNTPFNDLIPAGSSLKKTFFAKAEATLSDLTCGIHHDE